jgi:hypothetical protein
MTIQFRRREFIPTLDGAAAWLLAARAAGRAVGPPLLRPY